MGNAFANEMADYEPTANPPKAPGKLCFTPNAVFYDAGSGRYHIELESHYRTYSRKTPVIEGVTRHYIDEGLDPADARKAAKCAVLDAEIDRAVDWSGAIAGHRRGILRKNGQSLLVTSEPTLVDPVKGPFGAVAGIIRQAFPDPDARTVFCLWLAHGYRAVVAGVHQAAPMLVLAGEVNSGKSLLAWIAAQVLGGRVGHPGIAWSGTLPWNDDLAGSELLLLDDSVGSHDMRKRLEFAARFKESIYGSEVAINRRHQSSVSLRPVWRVMVCCNRTPEALSIVPPLDADLDDKVSLLSVSKVVLPLDTSTPEGKGEMQAAIREELPGFISYITTMEIPDHLRDSRAGVGAWRDPELVSLLDGIDESARFADPLVMALNANLFNCAAGESIELTAGEIESAMTSTDSPVREQARQLLGRHHAVTGRILGKLASGGSDLVTKGKNTGNRQHWRISKPTRELG